MTTDFDLTDYRALSFDCYGTLIDWEAGIAAVLAPWARAEGLDVTDEELLLAYADNESAVERETPVALYPEVLATAFRRTGERLGGPVTDEWAQRLGNSVPEWPAFPDSSDALARLAKHYQLIILSNLHRDGFAGSNQRLNGDFAAIITAEDVGAYKPAENHFRALDATLPKLGVDRTELLHVAVATVTSDETVGIARPRSSRSRSRGWPVHQRDHDQSRLQVARGKCAGTCRPGALACHRCAESRGASSAARDYRTPASTHRGAELADRSWRCALLKSGTSAAFVAS
jgi:putative hydrolase of the HAD superfamily